MYRSYPGGREDRTIPVLPDFNRTADPRRRHSHKTQNAHVRPPRRHRRHTIAPRSFRGPARPHPCNTAARGEVAGSASGCATLRRIIRGKCSATRQATPPFFGVRVLMSLISRTHYNTFSSHASYTQWGGPLWCTEHAHPCSPQHGRGAAITGSCTARLYSISSSASPPPPPLALIALRLLRPGRPPP